MTFDNTVKKIRHLKDISHHIKRFVSLFLHVYFILLQKSEKTSGVLKILQNSQENSCASNFIK